jgi:N-acetylneuraminic acid mutarotase
MGSLTQYRTGFTLVALPNGSALVAGGLDPSSGSEAVATAELLDRATNQWKPTASMNSAAANRVAVVLANGKVLVAGGLPGLHQPAIENAELYDPAGGTWTATKAMPMTLERAGAVLLSDGSVLVAGGDGGFPGSAAYLDPRLDAVRYYPA